VTELDALLHESKRHHKSRLEVHVHEHYSLGEGCTIRAVTFGDDNGIPYLLPNGWTPVMSEDGTRVTLQKIDGSACAECAIEAGPVVVQRTTEQKAKVQEFYRSHGITLENLKKE
jgi:hypothetical protein